MTKDIVEIHPPDWHIIVVFGELTLL